MLLIVHVFHIHQIHFLLTHVDGVPLAQPIFRDVLEVATWSGKPTDPFPNVTILLDLRSPLIVGQFPYHCHILGHEDNGMMAKIEVLPGKLAVPANTKAPVLVSMFSSSTSSAYSISDPVVIGLIAVSLIAALLLAVVFVLLLPSKQSTPKSQEEISSRIKESIDTQVDEENPTPDPAVQPGSPKVILKSNSLQSIPPVIDYSSHKEENDQWANQKS